MSAAGDPHELSCVVHVHSLSARRRVPAIGGLDDHQRGLCLRGRVRSPVPHWRTFNLLRTHLLCERPLSGEIDRDRETIITALRSGAAWLIWPCVARARGARMWAESSDGSTIGIGAEGSVGSSVLRLRLPRSADVTVLRDGAAIHAGHSGQLDLDIPDRGTYRVEARIDGRFWLLSNPIHLR